MISYKVSYEEGDLIKIDHPSEKGIAKITYITIDRSLICYKYLIGGVSAHGIPTSFRKGSKFAKENVRTVEHDNLLRLLHG